MSISAIAVILKRIESATKESPIAVFSLLVEIKDAETGFVTWEMGLNAVFGATVTTQKRLEFPDGDFVGVFDRTMKKKDIRKILRAAIKPEPAVKAA